MTNRRRLWARLVEKPPLSATGDRRHDDSEAGIHPVEVPVPELYPLSEPAAHRP
ncbi:hypothetical protein [Streptomyces sp. NK15101]|uniref:hypothetical protein n=1 Tax=Streptomyces sp. NK15101 TaxID=2873261 RepID=UPI001CEC4A1E|nr:hypothetical protein [Streptomyces sp. NK15101]